MGCFGNFHMILIFLRHRFVGYVFSLDTAYILGLGPVGSSAHTHHLTWGSPPHQAENFFKSLKNAQKMEYVS